MRVLVTRPKEDAGALKAALEAAGHSVVLAPMMRIAPNAEAPSLDGAQALLFTSANGVRAFAAASPERGLPAWTVGPATAAAAKAAGFMETHVADGDARSLARDVIAALRPGNGALVHAAGSIIKKELGLALTEAGFSYRKAVLYEAVAIGNLPEDVQAQLRDGTLDAVLLFSPRTARLFLEKVAQAGLGGSLQRLRAYCLSPAVAEAAGPAHWLAVHAADRPDTAALVSLMAIES